VHAIIIAPGKGGRVEYSEGIFTVTGASIGRARGPLFGFGLSYTSSRLSGLAIDHTRLEPGGKLDFSLEIREHRPARVFTVVQVYARDLEASAGATREGAQGLRPSPTRGGPAGRGRREGSLEGELGGGGRERRVHRGIARKATVKLVLGMRSLTFFDRSAVRLMRGNPGSLSSSLGQSSVRLPLRAHWSRAGGTRLVHRSRNREPPPPVREPPTSRSGGLPVGKAGREPSTPWSEPGRRGSHAAHG